MDLNELFYHHQLALMRAESPPTAPGDECCAASHFGQRIAQKLERNRATIRPPVAAEACCA